MNQDVQVVLGGMGLELSNRNNLLLVRHGVGEERRDRGGEEECEKGLANGKARISVMAAAGGRPT